MDRFQSLDHAPSEARRLLRHRFAKNLLPSPPATMPLDGLQYPDEAVLELLNDLTVEHNADLGRTRRAYAAIRAANPGAPTFKALQDAGWIRVARGRVQCKHDVVAMHGHDSPLSRALRALRSHLYGVRYRVRRSRYHANRLADLTELLLTRPDNVRVVRCATPSWVAARLWERLCDRDEGNAAGMALWESWWRLLGYPAFAPSSALSPSHAEAFLASALRVLDEPGVLMTWDDVVERRALFRAFVRNAGAMPSTLDRDTLAAALIDRWAWLDTATVSGSHEEIELLTGAPQLCGLLCEELAVADIGPAPHPLASAVLALAVDRPELLSSLQWRVNSQPALLADLCLVPTTTALACLWVAGRGHYPSAFDRHTVAQHDDEMRLVAFEDALSVADHHLRAGALPPAEIAPLARVMRERANSAPATALLDAGLLRATYDMLSGQSREVLEAIVETLAAGSGSTASGRASLAAALDLVATGLLHDTIKILPILDAYSKTLGNHGGRYFAAYIDARAAAALVALALRGNAGTTRGFFHAVDVARITDDAVALYDNRYLAVDDASRALRAHIRILARAVTGWVGTIPSILADALVANVQEGQFEDAGSGQWPGRQVDVFSALFETSLSGNAEPSIADDLALAFDRLHVDQRAPLLAAALETREPAFLARLMAQSPASLTDAIATRLKMLAEPGAAGAIVSLTEAQVRINQLLCAGKLEEAEHFIKEEAAAETWGKVPERDLVRLQQSLQLLYRKRDFASLREFKVPAMPGGPLQQASADTVEFFKGLAWMEAPGESLDFAASLFARLREHRRDVSGYTVNYFAARIRFLIGPDAFGQIPAANADAAREVLADARQVSAIIQTWQAADRDIFDVNLALLLLAAGSPDEALARLSAIRSPALEGSVAVYTAIAQSRTGRSMAALATIEAAVSRLGPEPMLVAAKAHVDRGEEYKGQAVAVAARDTLSPGLLIHFLAMSPHQRAGVLGAGPSPERARAIEEVRGAVGALQELTFVLRSKSDHPIEDDITSLSAKLLEARQSLLGWTWHEQSRGGTTAAGNPGSRDLALKGQNTTYAVLEAVVIDRPVHHKWSQGELLSHYLKLPAYSTTKLFFHVVYSYAPEPRLVLDTMREIARTRPPVGFSYIDQSGLDQTGSMPPGFMAEYTHSMGQAFVVFLVVDLRQQLQRDNATAADAENPRRKNAVAKTTKATVKPKAKGRQRHLTGTSDHGV
ncbi:hypothetical protein ACVWWJ_002679 [Luteibacter sp. HA06]